MKTATECPVQALVLGSKGHTEDLAHRAVHLWTDLWETDVRLTQDGTSLFHKTELTQGGREQQVFQKNTTHSHLGQKISTELPRERAIKGNLTESGEGRIQKGRKGVCPRQDLYSGDPRRH